MQVLVDIQKSFDCIEGYEFCLFYDLCCGFVDFGFLLVGFIGFGEIVEEGEVGVYIDVL